MSTNNGEQVTFTLPSGAKVTCSREQAGRLGYKPEPAPKSEPKKPTRRRTNSSK